MAKDYSYERYINETYTPTILGELVKIGDRVVISDKSDEADIYIGLTGQVGGKQGDKFLVNFDDVPSGVGDDFEHNKYFDVDDLEVTDSIGEAKINEEKLDVGDRVQIRDTTMVSRAYVGHTGQITGKIGDEFIVQFEYTPQDSDDDIETNDRFDAHCLKKNEDIGE